MSGAAVSGAAVSGALARYQVMAVVVGIGLLVLVLVGMPLQYGAHEPALADIVAPVHGILYIVYLLTVFDLARRQHFRIGQLAAMICAGFVPFVAFLVEQRVTRELRRQNGHGSAPAPEPGA